MAGEESSWRQLAFDRGRIIGQMQAERDAANERADRNQYTAIEAQHRVQDAEDRARWAREEAKRYRKALEIAVTVAQDLADEMPACDIDEARSYCMTHHTKWCSVPTLKAKARALTAALSPTPSSDTEGVPPGKEEEIE